MNQDATIAQEQTYAVPMDLSERIEGLNINAKTYLATDYLNHFGEVIMLLDLLCDMPEVFEEIRDWQPKTYEQHFLDSGFAQSEVYVLAYEQAPDEFRAPFDSTIATLQDTIGEGLKLIGQIIDQGKTERLADAMAPLSLRLQALNSLAGAIVNGDYQVNQQGEIDAMFDD